MPKPAPKYIRCAEQNAMDCRRSFAPTFPGQKSGACDRCKAQRRLLATAKRLPRRTLTRAENDELRTLERITHKVGIRDYARPRRHAGSSRFGWRMGLTRVLRASGSTPDLGTLPVQVCLI